MSQPGKMRRSRDQARLERGFFLLLLLLVTVAFFYLLKPFVGSLFWAVVIGLLFYPLQRFLTHKWAGRRNLAALTTLTLALFIVVVPLLVVVALFFQEGVQLYEHLQRGEINLGDYINSIKVVLPTVQSFLDHFHFDLASLREWLSSAALTLSRYVAQNAVALGQGTVRFFFDFGIMLYLAFFMLREGPELVDILERALPLGNRRERLLLDKFSEVTRATIKGSLVVAVVQGTIGGVTFWFLGIPAPILWGVVMTLLSLVPVVGASLVWVPAALIFLLGGHWVKALILVAIGAGVIGLIDNFLRPLLVGRDTKLPDYMVLLSTLGGFILFGMNGFVMGPLLAALFVAFWGIFTREFQTTTE